MLPIIWLAIGIGFGTRFIGLSISYLALAMWAGANPWGRSPVLWAVAMITGGLLAIAILARPVDSRLRYLFASVALAAALNAVGGGESGPGGLSSWLQSLGISPELAWQITVIVRKAIHFAYYGLVALTAHLGCQPKIPIWAISWAIVLACFDEYRQSSAPGRTGTVWDVVLDFSGAIAYVGLAMIVERRRDAGVALHEDS